MSRRKRTQWAGMIVVAALAACSEEPPREAAPTPVKTQVVATQSGGGGVRYSANVEPAERVEVAFKVGGYVEAIRQAQGVDGGRRHVQEGDWVSRGAVLASVREADYAVKVSEARAALSGAEAGLTQARLDHERAEALFASKSLTKPEYDGARAALDSALASVERARAIVNEAELALADCSLRAPMDALVLNRAIEVGALVAPGSVGFVLADTRSVKAVFGVPDVAVQSLKMGDRLLIATEALRGVDFESRITRIAPFADTSSRVFEVEVTIPNRDGSLKPGMIASLQIGGQAGGDALPAVPLTAIVRPRGDPDGYGLFVVEEAAGREVARARVVTLGRTFGNLIAITSGVAPGERVIVTGATLVLDGAPVRVIP